jgi:hypothetical protein
MRQAVRVQCTAIPKYFGMQFHKKSSLYLCKQWVFFSANSRMIEFRRT